MINLVKTISIIVLQTPDMLTHRCKYVDGDEGHISRSTDSLTFDGRIEADVEPNVEQRKSLSKPMSVSSLGLLPRVS